MKLSNAVLFSFFVLSLFLAPSVGYCDVIGTLQGVQSTLVTKILPLCAVLGLCWSAFSFFTGNPAARSHLFLAIAGMFIGFGAEQIMKFIQSLVR